MNPRHIHNHTCGNLSSLDLRMVRAVPAGGNWKNIPTSVPSKRLEQIRASGGRTTYYGRLRYDFPAYTISTYFNRPGNGCYIHPDDGADGAPPQHRLLTFREAARLQSFPDSFVFEGPNTSILKQIGNAVPPLLARALATSIPGHTFADMFAGAGGLSSGFQLANKKLVGAIDFDRHACRSFSANHCAEGSRIVCGDITNSSVQNEFISMVRRNLKGKRLDILAGGPPCQGFSLAGNRFTDDPRNRLFAEFIAVATILKPRTLLMENVPGLMSARNGSALTEILRCFRSLGYIVREPVVLHADHYGVPQKRKRLFILGHDRAIAPAFPPAPMFGANTPARSVTVRDAISDLPPIYAGLGINPVAIKQKSLTPYQAFMAGTISFSEFLKIHRLSPDQSIPFRDKTQRK